MADTGLDAVMSVPARNQQAAVESEDEVRARKGLPARRRKPPLDKVVVADTKVFGNELSDYAAPETNETP